MPTLNHISEQIVSTSIIPVVMIPACSLLSMIFNNRLMPILAFLSNSQDDLLNIKYKSLKHKKTEESEIEAFFYAQDYLWIEQSFATHNKRAQLLRWGIVFEYSAIFSFALAAICILLSIFSQALSYASGALLVIGTILVMTGLSFGFREILMAISSLGENSAVIKQLADEMSQKFDIEEN